MTSAKKKRKWEREREDKRQNPLTLSARRERTGRTWTASSHTEVIACLLACRTSFLHWQFGSNVRILDPLKKLLTFFLIILLPSKKMQVQVFT
jgi:hypothetical protein